MMSKITEETVTKLYDLLAASTRYYYHCQTELLEAEEAIEEAKANHYRNFTQTARGSVHYTESEFDLDTVIRFNHPELYQEKRRAKTNLYNAEANLRIAELEREKYHILLTE